MKNSFEIIILLSSKRKPSLFETDRRKEFCNYLFRDFLSKNNIKIHSRSTSLGAVFAERFNRSMRNLLRKPVFEKSAGIWIDVLPTITKQNNIRVHTSTKLSPRDGSLKDNQGLFTKNY